MTRLKRLRNRYMPWHQIVSGIEELASLHALALAEGEESLAAEISATVVELEVHVRTSASIGAVERHA